MGAARRGGGVILVCSYFKLSGEEGRGKEEWFRWDVVGDLMRVQAKRGGGFRGSEEEELLLSTVLFLSHIINQFQFS